MDILIILFIVLMIVTVVGHLNWVAIRWIGRWFSADEVVTDEEPRKQSDPRHQRMKTDRWIAQAFVSDSEILPDLIVWLLRAVDVNHIFERPQFFRRMCQERMAGVALNQQQTGPRVVKD